MPLAPTRRQNTGTDWTGRGLLLFSLCTVLRAERLRSRGGQLVLVSILQVTVEYKNDGGAMVPQRVHTILISTQHDETVTNERIAEDLHEKVIKPVVPSKYLDDKTIYHLNPSGRFVIGGPHGDAGLTGRKIIIDTYGEWGAHGGGAFSGKDPTKVDRSGAYIARQVRSLYVCVRGF